MSVQKFNGQSTSDEAKKGQTAK